MIFCFRFSKARVCSSVHSHSVSFSSSCLKLSVCADKLSIYLDRYWMAPRNDLSSFSLFGCFRFFIAINLSCNGLIPFGSILWPIQSISVLKNSDLVSLNLYPAFSSLVKTSTSFLVLFFRTFCYHDYVVQPCWVFVFQCLVNFLLKDCRYIR